MFRPNEKQFRACALGTRRWKWQYGDTYIFVRQIVCVGNDDQPKRRYDGCRQQKPGATLHRDVRCERIAK